ncbi:MAG: ribosome maturation factor RimM [Chloroflexota bacterium]|nr:ribosome maturation factor RimM [Chloroflexota bacterium]MDE2942280.1 ribosome maturation factor RimM [Chloroflexota bacterium]MDE3266989.1 ribosome maturation factor RimM [Chloroflexota bacterium]
MDSSGKLAGAPERSGNPHPLTAVVGVIVGPWGNAGEVRVQPHTDNPRRFVRGDRLMAAGRILRSEGRRTHRGMALVKFQGIDTREDASRLAGVELEVPVEDVPPLPDGSYYHFQILDMEVWTASGELLGVVEDILSTGSNDVYVVRRGAEEVLVPAIESVVLQVDVDGGRITVDLPDGLR